MQSDWAVELSPSLPDGPILELCAGAGHIGLLVAKRTGRPLVQVETDATAARYALTNATLAGIDPYNLRQDAIGGAVSHLDCFPMIIADPPYVPSGELWRYPDDPPTAIDGGADGLVVIRDCLRAAARALAPGGALLMQVRGASQANEVATLLDHLPRRFEVTEVRAVDDTRAVTLVRAASESSQNG